MANKMEQLNKLLTEAAAKLDKSAALIADLDLDRISNRERIAEALANIFDIQHQIYIRQPELRPDYLRYEISAQSQKPELIEDEAD